MARTDHGSPAHAGIDHFRDERGTLRVYATDTRRGVTLDGEARVFVSPEDTEGRLAALEQQGASIDRAGT